MQSFDIPTLPISLIPTSVAPPPRASPSPRAAPDISTRDDVAIDNRDDAVDDVVIDNHVDTQVMSRNGTIDLMDSDGERIVDSNVNTPLPDADTLQNTLSLKQLRDRCTALGLNAAGKKSDLAERIVAA